MQSLKIYRFEPLWVGISLKYMPFFGHQIKRNSTYNGRPVALSRLRGWESARQGKMLHILPGNGLTRWLLVLHVPS